MILPTGRWRCVKRIVVPRCCLIKLTGWLNSSSLRCFAMFAAAISCHSGGCMPACSYLYLKTLLKNTNRLDLPRNRGGPVLKDIALKLRSSADGASISSSLGSKPSGPMSGMTRDGFGSGKARCCSAWDLNLGSVGSSIHRLLSLTYPFNAGVKSTPG